MYAEQLLQVTFRLSPSECLSRLLTKSEGLQYWYWMKAVKLSVAKIIWFSGIMAFSVDWEHGHGRLRPRTSFNQYKMWPKQWQR